MATSKKKLKNKKKKEYLKNTPPPPPKPRSGMIVAAEHRPSAGEMKYRPTERGGSKNEERALISEYVNDVLEKVINSSKQEEKSNLSDEDGEEDEFEL